MAFVTAPPFHTSRSGDCVLTTPLRLAPNAPAHVAPVRQATLRTGIVSCAKTRVAREVTGEELEVTLQANERPVLVDAFAPWCGPCQFLLPQLDIVADKFGERLDVLKLDTEAYPDLASALMIRGLPTLFFIKDGKLRYRMEGALTADQLEKLVDYVLFDGPPPASPPPGNPPPTPPDQVQ